MTMEPRMVKEIVSAVDDASDEIISFLQSFLAFKTESQDPSASHYLPEADACRDFLSNFLSQDGYDVTQWEAESVTFERHPVLAGRLPGSGDGRSIALNGHFDVVPAGASEAWDHNEWGEDIVDGKLYGRGAVDMKGGIAAMLWAVRCLRRVGVDLRGDVWAHLVSDEEVVGHGTRECVERLPKVDAAIDPEPSNMAITPATGGLEHMRIEIWGESAHAGVRYRSLFPGSGQGGGVNAIEKMAKLMASLQEYERERANHTSHPLLPPGFNTILPGIIMGGPGGGKDGQLNMVSNPGTTPDYCSLEYNIWYYPGESLDEVKAGIERRIGLVASSDKWLREHPPKVTWSLRGISFPAASTDSEHDVVQSMSRALEAVGLPLRIEGATYVTDLSWYEAAGIPGFVFAPGSIDQAHSPNEYVELDKLIGATKALAIMLLDWSG